MLDSWLEGAVKSAILDFVARVTKEGGRDFVPPAERIATFDNDGTLWCEQPFQVQVFFLIDRVRQLAANDPSLKQRQPFKALLEGDHATLHALGKRGVAELFAATHTGMTVEEFEQIAVEWFATAKHPKFGRLFKQCTYRPQVELLEYLRTNGFKTYIVSGGGIELIRAFAAEAYGIPREQIIGTSGKLHFEINGDRWRCARAPSSTASTIARPSPRTSGCKSVADPSSRSVTPTEISRCSATRSPDRERAWDCCCITMTPRARSLTTGSSS